MSQINFGRFLMKDANEFYLVLWAYYERKIRSPAMAYTLEIMYWKSTVYSSI